MAIYKVNSPVAHLMSYTYGGHSVFRVGRNYYVINSRHLTKSNAEKSPAYKDSFYLGKTKSKIVKYGKYWIVLQPVALQETKLGLIRKGSGRGRERCQKQEEQLGVRYSGYSVAKSSCCANRYPARQKLKATASKSRGKRGRFGTTDVVSAGFDIAAGLWG